MAADLSPPLSQNITVRIGSSSAVSEFDYVRVHWESPPIIEDFPIDELPKPYIVTVTPRAADEHDAFIEVKVEVDPNYYGDQSTNPQNLASPLRISTVGSESTYIEAAYMKSQENIGETIARDMLLGMICFPGGPVCDVVTVAGEALLEKIQNETQYSENRYVGYIDMEPQVNLLETGLDPVVFAIHLHSDDPISNWGTGGECTTEDGPASIRYSYDVPDPDASGEFVTLEEQIYFDFPTSEY